MSSETPPQLTFPPEGYPDFPSLSRVDKLPDAPKTALNPVEGLIMGLVLQAVEEPIRAVVKRAKGRKSKPKKNTT